MRPSQVVPEVGLSIRIAVILFSLVELVRPESKYVDNRHSVCSHTVLRVFQINCEAFTCICSVTQWHSMLQRPEYLFFLDMIRNMNRRVDTHIVLSQTREHIQSIDARNVKLCYVRNSENCHRELSTKLLFNINVHYRFFSTRLLIEWVAMNRE